MWNIYRGGGVPKIALKILKGLREDGGLGLIDLLAKQKSLKIAWIPYLDHDPEMSNMAYSTLGKTLGVNIWKCNLSASDLHAQRTSFLDSKGKGLFWYQVLEAWCEINFCELVEDGMNQCIWYNSHICIGGMPIHWTLPISKGLLYIYQLYKNGALISVRRAYELFGLQLLDFHGIVTAIPNHWKTHSKNSGATTMYEDFLNQTCVSKIAYRKICANNMLLEVKCKKWESELGKEIAYPVFLECFKDLYKVTNIVKYRSFQYRILQRSLTTNIQLCRYRLRNDELCTLCNKHWEMVIHLMIFCEKVQNFWISVENFMYDFGDEKIHFDVDTVLCNKLIDDPKNVKNFICLLAKQYIYKQRCLREEISFAQFKRHVLHIKNIEKYIAIARGKQFLFCKKWGERMAEPTADVESLENVNTNDYALRYIMENV